MAVEVPAELLASLRDLPWLVALCLTLLELLWPPAVAAAPPTDEDCDYW